MGNKLERFLLNKNVSVSYREGYVLRVLTAVVKGHDKNFIFLQNELGGITTINKYYVIKIVEAINYGK